MLSLRPLALLVFVISDLLLALDIRDESFADPRACLDSLSFRLNFLAFVLWINSVINLDLTVYNFRVLAIESYQRLRVVTGD